MGSRQGSTAPGTAAPWPAGFGARHMPANVGKKVFVPRKASLTARIHQELTVINMNRKRVLWHNSVAAWSAG